MKLITPLRGVLPLTIDPAIISILLSLTAVTCAIWMSHDEDKYPTRVRHFSAHLGRDARGGRLPDSNPLQAIATTDPLTVRALSVLRPHHCLLKLGGLRLALTAKEC